MPDAFAPPRSFATWPLPPARCRAQLGLFGPVTPSPSLALPVAERVRAALMRACPQRRVPWQLSGKDHQGRPRRGHDHLYILPFGSGAQLDRVLLWARDGLTTDMLELLARLRRRGGWVQLPGCPRLRLELLDGHTLPSALFGPARRWRSATAFLPPRFPRRRRGEWVDTPADQLAWLCGEVIGHVPQRCEPDLRPGVDWTQTVQTRLDPRRGWPARRPSGWRLSFDRPVFGPLALGLGAHLGLGRFVAEPDA